MTAVASLAAVILAAVVVVEVARALCGVRRRVRLNRALHELRRPIQSLSLALESAPLDPMATLSWIDQLRDALAELDAEINGRVRAPALSDVPLEDVAVALERRWRCRGVRVEAPAEGPLLRADPRRLGAALDNLVANALGHGSGSVSVRALTAPGVARLEVRDGGAAPALAPAGDCDPRHGHGLAVAAGTAASQGGGLIPPHRTDEGATVAAITVPVAEAPVPPPVGQ